MKFRQTFAIFFFFLSILTHAQSDYVVIGDTAQRVGSIQYKTPENTLKFKATDEDVYLEYSISDISEFEFKKKKFLRKNINGEDLFLRELVSGRYSLFAFGDSFFIEEQNEMLLFDNTNYSSQLNKIFGGNCNWEFNINHLMYEEVFLSHLVKGYTRNECFLVQKFSTSFSIELGVSKQKLNLEDEKFTEQMDGAFTLGVGITRETPLFNQSSFILSVDIINEKNSKNLNTDFSRNVVKVDINNINLLWSIQVRYYFNQVYFNVGPAFDYRINNSSLLKRKQGGIIEKSKVDLGSIALGYTAGFGYRIVHQNNYQISIEVQNKLWTGSDLKSSFNSISFKIEI